MKVFLKCFTRLVSAGNIHIVQPTAFAVQDDIDTLAFKDSNKYIRGEVTTLVRVEDLRRAVPRKRLFQRLDAERGIRLCEGC